MIRRTILLAVLAASLLLQPSWAGAASDQEPPDLSVIIPRVVNVEWVNLFGKTEIGATVLVNGIQVSTDEQGTFEARIVPVAFPAAVTVVASDEAGNESIITERVQRAGWVPWTTIEPVFGVSAKAPEGTLAREPGVKSGAYPDETGLVRWRYGTELGWNHYWIRFDPPGTHVYYHLYSVLKPLEIDWPARTNLERLSLPARLHEGWKLSIDGQTVTTDAEGRFLFTRNLNPGLNQVRLEFTMPEGLTLNRTYQVDRAELPETMRIKDGQWQLQVFGKPGTVYMLEGSPGFLVPVTEEGYWGVPLVPGKNDIKIRYTHHTGETGLIWYQFQYDPTK